MVEYIGTLMELFASSAARKDGGAEKMYWVWSWLPMYLGSHRVG